MCAKESCDIGIVKRLRKFQYWAKKLFSKKTVYSSLFNRITTQTAWGHTEQFERRRRIMLLLHVRIKVQFPLIELAFLTRQCKTR